MCFSMWWFGDLLKIHALCDCYYQTAEMKVKVTTDVVIIHLGFP